MGVSTLKAGLLRATSTQARPEPDTPRDVLPPSAYTINDVVRMGGMSRATVFREMRAGRLKARKLGARTLILASDWRDYLDSLPLPRRLGNPSCCPGETKKAPNEGCSRGA